MGPHPLNSAQTHPEWLARQTRSCPQSSQILLELPRRTLHRWQPPHQGWMSGHSTILQRQYYGRPPWKPCWHQQGNGPGQNMHLLAQHGSRCNWLHQAMPHMHWVQQPTQLRCCKPTRSLPDLGCWLLSRAFGEKAPNSGRLLQQVPVCVSSGIHTSFQDHYPPKGTLCSWRRTHYCHVWQWTSLQWRRVQAVFPWFWLRAHHIITPFPSVKWIHWGNGEESQKHLQEDGWISQCSG